MSYGMDLLVAIGQEKRIVKMKVALGEASRDLTSAH